MTTSVLEQPATPISSISIGLGPRLTQPSAAEPSMTTLWPASSVATKHIPSIHFEVICMILSCPEMPPPHLSGGFGLKTVRIVNHFGGRQNREAGRVFSDGLQSRYAQWLTGPCPEPMFSGLAMAAAI